jgi:hypothetical protein
MLAQTTFCQQFFKLFDVEKRMYNVIWSRLFIFTSKESFINEKVLVELGVDWLFGGTLDNFNCFRGICFNFKVWSQFPRAYPLIYFKLWSPFCKNLFCCALCSSSSLVAIILSTFPPMHFIYTKLHLLYMLAP